jgi:hypothetical protein
MIIPIPEVVQSRLGVELAAGVGVGIGEWLESFARIDVTTTWFFTGRRYLGACVRLDALITLRPKELARDFSRSKVVGRAIGDAITDKFPGSCAVTLKPMSSDGLEVHPTSIEPYWGSLRETADPGATSHRQRSG